MSNNIWSRPLNMETFQIYAARFYQGVPTWTEFFESMRQFSLCSRLLVSRKHESHIGTNIYRILNAYIQLGNVFSHDSFARLAFFISNEEIYSELKTILYFIKRLPNSIPEVNLHDIPFQQSLLTKLNRV